MNSQHFSKLQEGIEEWNVWYRAEKENDPSFMPDLRGIEIAGTHSQYFNLEGIQLDDVDLQGAKLQYVNLNKASLRFALVGMATLDHIYLEGVDLTNASFNHARLNNITFCGSTLKGVEFVKATIEAGHFENADLENAYLDLSTIRASNFFEANLKGAELRGARILDVGFENANLGNANLGMSYLQDVDLTGANFQNSNLKGIRVANIELDSRTRIRTPPSWFSISPYGSLAGTKDIDSLPPVCVQFSEEYKRQGIRDESGKFYYLERYYTRQSKNIVSRAIEFITLDALCCYGERPFRIIYWIIILILFSTFIYNWKWDLIEKTPEEETQTSCVWRKTQKAFYFSVVTFTTLGLGDYHPPKEAGYWWLQIYVAFEALMGVLLISIAMITYTRQALRS